MDRALREFRIRGVSTNIAFVINLLKHETFLDNTYTTTFIDNTPDLFNFKPRRDRATKILNYVADITVNGHPDVADRPMPDLLAKAPKLLSIARPNQPTAHAIYSKTKAHRPLPIGWQHKSSC